MAEAWDIFRRSPSAMLGLLLLGLVILMTFAGPFLYQVDPFEIVWAPLTPPGEEATIPLGTDNLGRDILAGLIEGGSATLAVGFAAAAITMLIGVVIGAYAGFYGGIVDDMLMRVTEFFQVLPPLLFAMVVVTLFQPTLVNVALAIGIVSWPQTARLTRSEFRRIRTLEYVSAMRAIGAGDGNIIWRVILPNALPPLIVSATLTIGMAILFEAGLSFLGLSDPNVMSWGLMIGSGREYLLDAWWVVTLPGAMIFLTVLGVSLVGDGLNDAFNPRMRER
ncbi:MULTISPECIES: ABC transporter permease [Paracoccus]|jgi:peptide/nickel transport system permease protein|nr:MULTISPECIES: ABC transporter permease [Paracoccus]MCU7430220.1 ABC transporter permease [Paracoccus denitrificans]MDK8873956.1 ABC transporter permease [Paracoccus sp. SSJ]QAR29209.1 ABC transporter permease [Paracoccus denitrificans]UFS67858.1 ABC transporter permease [Paracoccus denitrificans]UPV98153.1 ABC transporter permease [Paracoccus denitrificans]